jgi:hypothetical protein
VGLMWLQAAVAKMLDLQWLRLNLLCQSKLARCFPHPHHFPSHVPDMSPPLSVSFSSHWSTVSPHATLKHAQQPQDKRLIILRLHATARG